MSITYLICYIAATFKSGVWTLWRWHGRTKQWRSILLDGFIKLLL